MPDRLQNESNIDIPTEDHMCYHEQPNVKSFQSPYPPEDRSNSMPTPSIELVQTGPFLFTCDNESTEFPQSQPHIEAIPNAVKVFSSEYGENSGDSHCDSTISDHNVDDLREEVAAVVYGEPVTETIPIVACRTMCVPIVPEESKFVFIEHPSSNGLQALLMPLVPMKIPTLKDTKIIVL